MPRHPSEMQFLIEGYLANTLDETQQQQLLGALRADEAARRLYLEYMDLNAELQWTMQSRDGVRLAGEPGAATATGAPLAPLVFEAENTQGGASLFGPSPKPWALLLGGLLATLGVVWLTLFSPPGRPPVEEPAARHEPVAESFPTSLQLASGMAKLVIPKVGYVVLEGPGEFTLLNEKRARLSSGRIKMRVTEVTGRGFVVETPYGEITDLGTEFGVDLTEHGKAGLVVFEGSVDLRVAKSQQQAVDTSEAAQRLVGGEGVVFGHNGQFDRIGSILTGKVGTFLRHNEKSADGSLPLIVEVSDNLRTAETMKFYEIVPGGLREDVLAYVDRPEHEWNGMTEQGMPRHLIGADYIKTFCDDKWRTDIEIKVTLSRPAKLYVFYDEMLKPPKWLEKRFRKTSDTIGRDLGKWPPIGRPVESAAGAGVSIDHTFSVWQRTVRKPGVVTLGSNGRFGLNGKPSPYPHMYGIAAVALDEKPKTAEDSKGDASPSAAEAN